MDTAEFEALFAHEVVRPAERVGFVRWGKGLWFEQGGMRAALLRTELRWTWPFALTLVLSHCCIRDFRDRRPAPRSRNVSEWPVKVQPSRAPELLDATWSYSPWNLGRSPQDVMVDGAVGPALAGIGSAISAAFPAVATRLTPDVMLGQLRAHGEGAWCEQRWIADYEHFIAGT